MNENCLVKFWSLLSFKSFTSGIYHVDDESTKEYRADKYALNMQVYYQAMHAQACSLDVQSQPSIARRKEYFPISNMPFYPLRCFQYVDW